MNCHQFVTPIFYQIFAIVCFWNIIIFKSLGKEVFWLVLGIVLKIEFSHADVTETMMNPESSIDFGFVFESFPGVLYHFPKPQTILQEPLLMDDGHGVSVGVAINPPAEPEKPIKIERYGLFTPPPIGKYNTSESSAYDTPLFIDEAAFTSGGVPLAPYIVYEIDFDPSANGVSFGDTSQFLQLGMDKKISNSWLLGGAIKQGAYINGIGANSTYSQFSLFRIQAAYGTSFGLANVIRVEEIIWYGNNNPTYQTQRIEDFLRWDTQYSNVFYQFVGQRSRVRTDGGWDFRTFIGQGLKFNDYDTWELSVWEQWNQLGNGSQTGIYTSPHVSTTYSHTFMDKLTLYGELDWEGSTYATQTYQNSFGAEAGIRYPF